MSGLQRDISAPDFPTAEVPFSVETAAPEYTGEMRSSVHAVTATVDLDPDLERRRGEHLNHLLSEFAGLTQDDTVLLVSDINPRNADPALMKLIQAHCEARGLLVETVIAGEHSYEQILNATEAHSFIWSAHDWESDDAPWHEFVQKVMVPGRRMAHCAGITADTLDINGALAANKQEHVERLERMNHVLKPVQGFHIETLYGTDLWMELMPEQRRWFQDTGLLRMGGWDNFPGGEIFTTPHEQRVHGTLVLPSLDSLIDPLAGVDQPVVLTIRDGRIVNVEGGESAAKLREYWQRWSQKHQADTGRNPSEVVQCAEVAFGANAFARARAEWPCIPRRVNAIPTIEGEKRLGTMHIAFGDTKHGEPGTEGEVHCEPHLDFDIPGDGLTVTAFNSRSDWEGRKNGEYIVERGSWKHW